MLIYKILRADEWSELRRDGQSQGAPIDVQDGYVHFSTADQATETAAKHFAGATDLHLLAYEADALTGLEWEPSRGGALFPHLYGPLRLDQIRWHAALPLVDGAHLFPAEMHWADHFVDPLRAQFDTFKDLPRDHAIHMLNLIRLRPLASYPDTQAQSGMTGSEAYAAYANASAPVFRRVGGSILWRGHFEATLIGPVTDVWDVAFIACYPNAKAFLAMVTDLEYQKAVVHRQAAVETSRLIRYSAGDAGTAFA